MTPQIGASIALAQSTPAAAGSSWKLEPSLEISGRLVTAQSAVRAVDDAIDGDALAIQIAPAVELSNDDLAVTFRNTLTRLEFRDEDRADRWQNTARLTGRYAIDQATALTAFAERSENVLAAEFSSADEWEFGGEIEHTLDSTSRLQLGASWRERDYADAENSNGQGLRIDAEYRYRFGANHYAYLRGRFDEISSANPRRELDRWSVAASYQRPLADEWRIRSEIGYQQIDYPGRPVTAGVFRSDTVVTPEVTLIYSPGPWRISAESRYIIRNSTDPQFDRSGYRLALEVGHVF